jgi:GntR family transcriptional regulator/MocR family aminotransferase
MIPAVRTGFVLVPPGLRKAVAAARQLSDGYGSPPLQAALARFIDEGLLARHVRRAGREYARRHDAISRLISEMSELRLLPSAAGLHLTALLKTGAAAPIVRAAAKRGLAIEDLGRYATSQEGFVIGFGAIDPALIGEGMAIFADLLVRHA